MKINTTNMVNTPQLQQKLNKFFQQDLDQSTQFTGIQGTILRGEYSEIKN